MASGTLKHFGLAPCHFENFGMAISAFEFMLVDVGLMAKGYRPRGSVGFIYDIAPAYLILLSIGYANGKKG